MTIPLSKLVLPLLLSLSFIAIAHAGPEPDTNFIESACRAAHHAVTCTKSLSSRAAEIGNSTQKLAVVALDLSLDTAEATKTNLQKLAGLKGLKAQEYSALKLCLEEFEDSVDQLSHSVRELKPLKDIKGEDFAYHKSNIVTWTNGAVAHISTCNEEFAPAAMDGKIKETVMSQVTVVEDQIRNAISLIGVFASAKPIKVHEL